MRAERLVWLRHGWAVKGSAALARRQRYILITLSGVTVRAVAVYKVCAAHDGAFVHWRSAV